LRRSLESRAGRVKEMSPGILAWRRLALSLWGPAGMMAAELTIHAAPASAWFVGGA